MEGQGERAAPEPEAVVVGELDDPVGLRGNVELRSEGDAVLIAARTHAAEAQASAKCCDIARNAQCARPARACEREVATGACWQTPACVCMSQHLQREERRWQFTPVRPRLAMPCLLSIALDVSKPAFDPRLFHQLCACQSIQANSEKARARAGKGKGSRVRCACWASWDRLT